MGESEIAFKREAQGTHLDLLLEIKTPRLEFGHLEHVGGVWGGGTDPMTSPGCSPRPGEGHSPTLPVP